MFFLSILFCLGITLAIWLLIEAQSHQISRHDVNIHKPLSQPLKILHLSDMHFSGANPFMSRFFDRLAKED
jgi:hypothetical protein